ncbi:MAG: Crp/Fnr family transcriptional regulator [Desulfovibrionaceae bacterium]|nr:Crp/Fnr family transcriptional regulator [Desulfovibrionaceae bacterium]
MDKEQLNNLQQNVTVKQIITKLKQSIFDELTQPQIGALIQKAKLISFERRDIIYAQGQEELNPLILQSGLIKLSCNVSRGRECILHIIRPDAFVDLGVLFYEAGIPYTAIAVNAGKALSLDRNWFLATLGANGKFASKIIKIMVARQRMFINKLASSQGRISVSCRVSSWLLHRSKMVMSDFLNLDLNRELLARLLGVTRESLSRELNRLNQLGYISLTRKTVKILDKEALSKLALV